MNMEFVDRDEEIKLIMDYYRQSTKVLETIAIYGNRGIGKTELIKELSKNINSLYFFVNEEKPMAQLIEEYAQQLKEIGKLDRYATLKSWREFLDVLSRCDGYMVVFDEFQRFLDTDRSIFSELQNYLDSNKDKHMLIVFQGSSIGLMKSLFSDRKTPLYGRLATTIRIEQLGIKAIGEMLSQLGYKATLENIFNAYALFGGYPVGYSLLERTPKTETSGSIRQSIHNIAIEAGVPGTELMPEGDGYFNPYLIAGKMYGNKYAPLRTYLDNILMQDFGKRGAVYYAILEAIGRGATRIEEIAGIVGIKTTSLPRYIKDLKDNLEYIERISSMGYGSVGGKRSIYRINNPLIDLWFRLVYRNMGLVDSTGLKMDYIKEVIGAFLGVRFESFASKLIKDGLCKKEFALEFTHVGKWWGRNPDKPKGMNEEEIDIVAVNDKTHDILLAECKWTGAPVGIGLYADLKRKAKLVQWHNDSRKEHYALFSKAGFTDGMKEAARNEHVTLFDLDSIEKALGGGAVQ